MIKQPPWYVAAEKTLGEYRGLAAILLIAIILISIFMLLSHNNVALIAWVVYLLMP